MKQRRGNEKDSSCSSRGKLDPIHLDFKMTRLPANFLVKPHQKKVLCQVESMVSLGDALKREARDGNDNEDDDEKKDTCPVKVSPIPVDLEPEIMTRLPAKSLIKFQCVSKMWSSIIRSPKFIDSHYAISSATRSRFSIAFSDGPYGKRSLFIFSSSYEAEKSSSLVTNLDMVIPSVGLSPGSSCASIHGFIGCSGPFVVCNPTTKKVTTTPGVGLFTSLGYDPVDGQFKALTRVSDPYGYHDSIVHEFVTLGGGESPSSWRRKKVVSPPYYTATGTISIGGFVYHGAWTPTRSQNPVIVCYDVRYENISFIKAPMAVVCREGESILIEYKGKLASIVSHHPFAQLVKFDLWILEDVNKHDWSKQTFELPFSLGMSRSMTSPGTNKAGEIIFAPKKLSRDVQPFYIFYYNVKRKDIRRVRLLGIADDQEFRRVNGIAGECRLYILPEHIETLASL